MSRRHAFIVGKPARTYGYSAPILGPVVCVCRGDEVEMVVQNHLDAATTVHWHGLLVAGYNDGGSQQLIQAGERWRPVLNLINSPQHSGSIPTRTAIPPGIG